MNEPIVSAPTDPLARFGATTAEMREQMTPLFLWMYDHGITQFSIERNGTQAMVTLNGVSI